jgi:DNA mismatch endonuclease (patch repair protein)
MTNTKARNYKPIEQVIFLTAKKLRKNVDASVENSNNDIPPVSETYYDGLNKESIKAKNGVNRKSVVTYLRDGRAPIPENPATSLVMRGNKGKGTKPELLMRKALWAGGVRGYRLNYKNVPGHPDLAFIGKKIAVFVHGCFWHRCPNCSPPFPKSNISFWNEKFERNQQRDQNKMNELKALGWQVLTFWECEVKQGTQNIVRTIYYLIHRNDQEKS